MKTTRRRPALRHDTKKFKAKEARVAKMVIELVLSLGGFVSPRPFAGEMILPTYAGVLTVHAVSMWCSVMTRFAEPERARGRVSSNGKWNFHGFDDMEFDAIKAEITAHFTGVALPVAERAAGRAAALVWLAKDQRESEVRCAGWAGHMDGSEGKEASPVPASVDFELHSVYMSCYTREFATWRAKQGPGLVATKPAIEAVAVA